MNILPTNYSIMFRNGIQPVSKNRLHMSFENDFINFKPPQLSGLHNIGLIDVTFLKGDNSH